MDHEYLGLGNKGESCKVKIILTWMSFCPATSKSAIIHFIFACMRFVCNRHVTGYAPAKTV